MPRFLTVPCTPDVKTRLVEEAERYGQSSSRFVEVLLDGWDQLTDEQKFDAIRREQASPKKRR